MASTNHEQNQRMDTGPDATLLAQQAAIYPPGLPFVPYSTGQAGAPNYLGQPSPGFFPYPGVYQNGQMAGTTAMIPATNSAVGSTLDAGHNDDRSSRRARHDRYDRSRSPHRSNSRSRGNENPRVLSLLERLETEVLALRRLVKDSAKDSVNRIEGDLQSAVQHLDRRLNDQGDQLRRMEDGLRALTNQVSHKRANHEFAPCLPSVGGKGLTKNQPNIQMFNQKPISTQKIMAKAAATSTSNVVLPTVKLAEWVLNHPNELVEITQLAVVGRVVDRPLESIRPPGWTCYDIKKWGEFQRDHPNFCLWGVPVIGDNQPSTAHLFARHVAKAYAPPREANSQFSQSYYSAFASLFVYNDWPYYNQS